MSAFGDYLELLRISNLPTCCSNVLVGTAVVLGASAEPDWLTLGMVMVGVCLMYLGGMALNDAADADFDEAHRQYRPIPSGRIDRNTAWWLGGTLVGAGLALIGMLSLPSALTAGVLSVLIVAYDLAHRSVPGSVVLMGACRAAVYAVAAVSLAWPVDWSLLVPFMVSMTGYITLLTIVARMESFARMGRRRQLAFVLPGTILIPVLFIADWDPVRAGASAALAITWIAWSARHLWSGPSGAKPAIMGWLAGICLIDAHFLTLIGRLDFAIAAGMCFLITIGLHQMVEGT